MKYILVSCFLLCFVNKASLAQLPQTVVYLFDVHRSGKQLSLENPRIISNKKGYNNQPYFSPDGKYLFYVSSMDTSNPEGYYRAILHKVNSQWQVVGAPRIVLTLDNTPNVSRELLTRLNELLLR